MEGSPREEVFLGAFQFQPENIIQMFQLQVPETSCPCRAQTEHTPCAGLSPGNPISSPRSLGCAQLSLAHLTREETEAQHVESLPRAESGTPRRSIQLLGLHHPPPALEPTHCSSSQGQQMWDRRGPLGQGCCWLPNQHLHTGSCSCANGGLEGRKLGTEAGHEGCPVEWP